MGGGELGVWRASPRSGLPFCRVRAGEGRPEAVDGQRQCGLKALGLKVPVTGEMKRGERRLMGEIEEEPSGDA
jgi:hypothetical protein